MVKEYKDWLFVKVPEDADWFEFNDPKEGEIVYQNNGNDDMILQIPPGSYQIIGKGDGLGNADWSDIVERYIYSGRSSYYAYKDYSGKKPESEDDIIVDATESGYSLLRSLGMEPGTTIVLKKQN